jgi:hypothetical protein
MSSYGTGTMWTYWVGCVVWSEGMLSGQPTWRYLRRDDGVCCIWDFTMMYLLVCAELQTNLSHRMQSFIKSNCFGRCESMHKCIWNMLRINIAFTFSSFLHWFDSESLQPSECLFFGSSNTTVDASAMPNTILPKQLFSPKCCLCTKWKNNVRYIIWIIYIFHICISI